MPIQQTLMAGGTNYVGITISTNQTDYNLFTAAGEPAVQTTVLVTINSGIYVTSTAVATTAFDVGTGWAAGSICVITNNGNILGKGGVGAHWNGSTLDAAENGGIALKLQADLAVSVDNLNGAVAGGGGGGGGVRGTLEGLVLAQGGGGGAGGGAGGDAHIDGVNRTGGAGGTAGNAGSNGGFSGGTGAGAGGGRIIPGVGGAGCDGSTTAAQGGGSGGGGGSGLAAGGDGGTADAVGTAGANTPADSIAGGGGGGWGAAGGAKGSNNITIAQTVDPGTGGKCVDLNGQTITWINNGTRFGDIS